MSRTIGLIAAPCKFAVLDTGIFALEASLLEKTNFPGVTVSQ